MDGTTNIADASIFTPGSACKALGGSVRSGVNKQVQPILANSGVGDLTPCCIGLVEPHQIAVGVLKVTMPVTVTVIYRCR